MIFAVGILLKLEIHLFLVHVSISSKTTYYMVATAAFRRAQLAQSLQHEALNLRVVGSSPKLSDLFQRRFARKKLGQRYVG